MCERDDCMSISNRRAGQTIICAYLTELQPPILRDHTGTHMLKCALPTGSNGEKGDLYLFHLIYEQELPRCTRITPIPSVLYPVYRKILEEYRQQRMEALRTGK
ncbi:hypothetical protein GCK72_015698 [Caenorhabditis remanei]|uniref:Uncharacterized protein n=1 Tax=Caenorhabditis remanei TaxID=31234 RepID=E3MXX5_CAERE|nr:hypothetical protein GCK72_015698 [Caenorhabditis remanei]EFP11766.1 hypothetical protein CRE_26734 [Caenorhabditis remanei]KAF1759237.1 hypothetical protein GCK72_015698 [Caenorhabditis remanei]